LLRPLCSPKVGARLRLTGKLQVWLRRPVRPWGRAPLPLAGRTCRQTYERTQPLPATATRHEIPTVAQAIEQFLPTRQHQRGVREYRSILAGAPNLTHTSRPPAGVPLSSAPFTCQNRLSLTCQNHGEAMTVACGRWRTCPACAARKQWEIRQRLTAGIESAPSSKHRVTVGGAVRRRSGRRPFIGPERPAVPVGDGVC
jgi:hypothetical protein